MTAKKKAIELVLKLVKYTPVEFEYRYAKQCALICVEEMIKLVDLHCIDPTNYWQEVKKEIENL